MKEAHISLSEIKKIYFLIFCIKSTFLLNSNERYFFHKYLSFSNKNLESQFLATRRIIFPLSFEALVNSLPSTLSTSLETGYIHLAENILGLYSIRWKVLIKSALSSFPRVRVFSPRLPPSRWIKTEPAS